MLKRSGVLLAASIEGLEPRTLLSKPAPIEKFSEPEFFFNDIQASASGGTGASGSQMLIIRNAGVLPLTFNSKGLRFIGDDAADFVFTGKKAPATILPGKTRSIPLAFNATRIGIETATLLAVSNDKKHHSVSIQLRGLGTAGNGGNLEPSLQTILDLFQIPENVGEPHPDQTAFPIPPATPNDQVQLQTMEKAGSGPVTIDLLAVFDNFKTPATTVGWYGAGNPGSAENLFNVPHQSDAQSVAPFVSGATTFDPGSSEFGIYTVFPAFSNRHAYSQDNLNTWESVVSNQEKVRFYPLKNADGSVVPNAYVFASEDYNVTYDFNDVIGIIRNVVPGPGAVGTTGNTPPPNTGSSSGSVANISGLSVLNLDGAPSNDRVVFNRITNLDPIRPNVTHLQASVRLTNTSGSTIVISSISSLNTVDFPIVSGGGSNISLSPGQSRTVTMQFNGAGTGSSILKVFSSNLKITSGANTDTVVLEGLWQAYSEQTPADPSHVYDEPSLATIINTIFGYQTDIANAGQTKTQGLLVMLGTHGLPTPVGDEVSSDYWQAADSSQPVTVRMLAAFHRQNNFDPVTNAPLTAASSVRYYTKGSPGTTTKIFSHNINEGQSLLPHNANSTTAPAAGSFNAPGTFGFKIDSLYSDDSLNPLDFNPNTNVPYPGTGHAFRFFPLKDENGNVVANTYIMAMDYTGLSYSNYDYQDNIYIVSNMRPASGASAQMAVKASPAADMFSAASVKDDSSSILDKPTDSVL